MGILEGSFAHGLELCDLTCLSFGGKGDVVDDTIWVLVNDPVPGVENSL